MFQTALLRTLTTNVLPENSLSGRDPEDIKKFSTTGNETTPPQILSRKSGQTPYDSQACMAETLTAIKKNLPSLMLENEHQLAITALENFIQACPRATEAYFLLASVLEHAGAFDKALEIICIAKYLSCDYKIDRKRRAIETKALAAHRIPTLLKAKSYSANTAFFSLCSAENHEDLDARVKEETQRSISSDFLLLSRLSEDVDVQNVARFYANRDDNHDESGKLGFRGTSKPYRLADTFPFQCTATTPLTAGSLVMSDVPFAIAPLIDSDDPTLFPTCFHCLRERPISNRAIACPRFPKTCPFVFCSKECVLRNVNVHRQECSMISSIVFPLAKETGFSAGFILLVLRALIRAYIERSLRHPETEELRFFFRLHSYTSDYEHQRPWVWNCIKALCRGLNAFLPSEFRLHLNDNDFHQFIAVIHSHAIPVTYDVSAAVFQNAAPTGALGFALCHNVCSLAHSCIPTCSYAYTSAGRVTVRTLVDIPINGKLTISYIEDLFLPTARRKHLESSWKIITCSCRRCRELSEGQRHPRGQRCVSCIRGIRNPIAGKILRTILEAQKVSSQKRAVAENLPPSTQTLPDELSSKVSAHDHVLGERKLGGAQEVEVAELSEDPLAEKASWICSHCGVLSPLDATKCDALETQLAALLDEARLAITHGDILKARKILETVTSDYETLVHPNHYMLYNAHVMLAGLWNRRGSRNITKAHDYLRRALIAAHLVLPRFCPEKYHLYLMLADMTYEASTTNKLPMQGRGPADAAPLELKTLSSHADEDVESPFSVGFSPLEAAWSAVVNAWLTRGPRSPHWTAALHRLRQFAKAANRHTPPLLYMPKLVNVERTVVTMRHLLQSPALTPQEVMKMIQSDHQMLSFLACARGNIEPILTLTGTEAASKRELETPHLMTGLTTLGLAAYFGRVSVVRVLLEKFDVDIFAANEWGITPLLAMASRPLEPLFSEDEGSQKARKREDAAQAQVCLMLVKHAESLERLRLEQMRSMNMPLRRDPENLPDQFPFLRIRLLAARSHAALSCNTACHYAAARDKPMLTGQLVQCGLPPDIRNGEDATPLHLAAISGSASTLKELIRMGASVNATNYRGETALMMSAFGLHTDCVETLLTTPHIHVLKAARASGATVLHCLVLGITRTHRQLFLGSDRIKSDFLIGSLAGVNPLTKGQIYDSAGGAGNTEAPITYLTMPVYEADESVLFLFADKLLVRLDKADTVLSALGSALTPKLLRRRLTTSGHTAAELLRERADFFFEKYEEAWSRSDLKLAALSSEQRYCAIEDWRTAFARIDRLVDRLTPPAEDDTAESSDETEAAQTEILLPAWGEKSPAVSVKEPSLKVGGAAAAKEPASKTKPSAGAVKSKPKTGGTPTPKLPATQAQAPPKTPKPSSLKIEAKPKPPPKPGIKPTAPPSKGPSEAPATAGSNAEPTAAGKLPSKKPPPKPMTKKVLSKPALSKPPA